MAIFNPIDMMGPAHRGAQVQQLAQNAAQNVLRRQKMRALLAQGARGAAQAGAGQQINSSARMHPTGLRGLTLHGAGGLDMHGAPNGLGGNAFGNDGSMGNAGGGYDYPSIPAPVDPMQSAQSTVPGAVSQVPAPPAPSAQTAQTSASAPIVAPTTNPDGTQMSVGNDMGVHLATDPIHLGGGLYYDPNTDTVTGGLSTSSIRPGTHY
jgi:hypothetical protein